VISIKQSNVIKDLENISKEEADREIRNQNMSNQKMYRDESFKTKEMLAQYSLKVDSTNGDIVKILLDPKLRKTTVITQEFPILSIDDIKFRGENEDILELYFLSSDASSYDIIVNVDILGYLNNELRFVKMNLETLPQNSTLQKGRGLTNSWNFHDNRLKDIKLYYFRLFGQFKKSDGTLIPVENFYVYDKNQVGLKFGLPTAQMLKEIKSMYKR
jgi:hypothetical protein